MTTLGQVAQGAWMSALGINEPSLRRLWESEEAHVQEAWQAAAEAVVRAYLKTDPDREDAERDGGAMRKYAFELNPGDTVTHVSMDAHEDVVGLEVLDVFVPEINAPSPALIKGVRYHPLTMTNTVVSTWLPPDVEVEFTFPAKRHGFEVSE